MLHTVAEVVGGPAAKTVSRLVLASANVNGVTDIKDSRPMLSTPVAPQLALPFEVNDVAPVSAGSASCASAGPLWRFDNRLPGSVQTWVEQGASSVAGPSQGASAVEHAVASGGGVAEAGPNPALAANQFWWQGFPVGAMVMPVFFPIQGAFGDGKWQSTVPAVHQMEQQQIAHMDFSQMESQQLAVQHSDANCENSAMQFTAPAVPSRTAASRRQRRKQRNVLCAHEELQASHAHEGEASMLSLKDVALAAPMMPSSVEQFSFRMADSFQSDIVDESDETAEPSFFWPPTPEDTPPSSPRGVECIQQSGVRMQSTATVAPRMLAPSVYQAEDEYQHLVGQLVHDASSGLVLNGHVAGSVWCMASTPAGCRAVQQALDQADTNEQVAMAEQLSGHVWEACVSPHANHVLQKCIELVPSERVQFMLEELKGHAVNAARHRYGCRVLERFLEHCSTEQTACLVEEVLIGAPQLCRHTFGNFVIQHILVHGTPEQRLRVADILVEDVQRLARHRVASHVVRCALVHCAPEDRQRLTQAMSVDSAELADLAHHHCGSFVVREMKRTDGKRR